MDGRCEIVGRFVLAPGERFQYDVTARAEGVTLRAPAAGVVVTDLTGTIQARDGRVEIRGNDDQPRATGTLAGGSVAVRGGLAFDTMPIVIDPLEVDVKGVAVRHLPASWGGETARGNLPGKLSLRDGLASGSARLRVVITEQGGIESYGFGTATFEIPTFAGGSVSLVAKVGGERKKLDFTPRPPAPESGVLAREWRVGPSVWPYHTTQLTALDRPRFGDLVPVLALSPVVTDSTSDVAGLEATLDLKNIDLAQVVELLGLKLPGATSGRASVHAKLDVPLGEVTNPAAFRVAGRVSSPQLGFARTTVRDLGARLDCRGGKVNLTDFRGSVTRAGVADAPVGTFTGTASAAFDPPGPVTADLTLHALPVAALLGAVPGLKVDGAGFVSGRAEFRAPLATVADPATWRARAAVASNGVRVAGRTATDIHLAVVATDGTATLTGTRLTVEGIPVAVTGTLGLTGKRSFTAALTTTGTRIADLKRLASETKPPVDVDGELDTASTVVGTLSPLEFQVSGTIQARDVKIGASVANGLTAEWSATGERLTVSKLDLSVFDGTISGALDLPFAADEGGTFGLDFKGIDTARAVAAIPGFRRRVEGRVGGKLTGAIAPAREGGSRLGDVALTFHSPLLRVEAVDPKKLAPVEKIAGRVTLTNGVLGYHLTADIAKGKLVVDRPTTEKGSAQPGRGSLQLTAVDLTRLGKDLGIDFLRPIRGKFNVSFDHDADFTDGTGKVSVRELAWDREPVPSELSGAITLRDGELTLGNFGGPFARGLLRARAKMRVDDPTRNSVTLAISQADARRLLAPVPEAADRIDGKVSINLQVKVGDIHHASGTVVLTRGSVGGISVPELRLPVDVLSYPGGYGRLTIREATARAGTGRATASAIVQWGAGTRVEGKVRFVKLPLRSLAPSVGNSSFLGGGRLTGRFDIAGANVRSADDLTGKLVARLDDATVGELPLLRQTIPYLNTIGVTKPFDTGDIEANLSRGVFRIQRLAMSNPSAQLFASGTVTVAGRLDVDVTAHTGDVGPSPGAVQVLARAVPAVGPIPIGLISDVTAFLSDRTVKLTIGGTAASPKIRLNTASLLREEAVRFFVKRYVPPSVSNAMSAGGIANIAQEQIRK